MKSEYDKLALAYREGQLACKNGKKLIDNPYLEDSRKSHSFSPRGSWVRGWLSHKMDKKA